MGAEILILGGGFAGVSTARELERRASKNSMSRSSTVKSFSYSPRCCRRCPAAPSKRATARLALVSARLAAGDSHALER